ncbi:hypothetical protein JCM11641_002114 [Rhodosporidiobolus odoratus]
MPAPKLKGARKATQYRSKQIQPEKPFNKSDSRLRGNEARIQTYQQVMTGGTDEDQFHLNRDTLSLEDLDPSNSHSNDPNSDLESVDEIYSLPPSLQSNRKPSPSPSPSSREEEDDETERPLTTREKALLYASTSKAKRAKTKLDEKSKGRFGHEYDPDQDVVYPSSSSSGSDPEEDVGGEAAGAELAESDQDHQEEAGSGKEPDSDDDEHDGDERWAAGQYHATRSAPGEADSEDDEAAELELDEAKRLQKKARERLAGSDFGIEEDEDDHEEGDHVEGREKEKKDVLRDDTEEGLGEQEGDQGAQELSEDEAIALLLRTRPEVLALVDDYVLTASKVKQVREDLEQVRKEGEDHPARGVLELEYQALTTYLPTLTFYFSLLLTPLPSRLPSHSHLESKVLDRLSSLRGYLATMDELELTSARYGEEEDDEEEEESEESGEEDGEEVPRGKRRRVTGRGMLASEAMDLADLLGEEDLDEDEDVEDDEDEEGAEEGMDSMLAGLDDSEVQELVSKLQPGDGAEELMKMVRERRAEKEEEEEGLDDDAMDVEEEQEAIKPVKAARKPKSKSIEIPSLAPLSSSSSSSTKVSKRSAPSSSTSTATSIASAANDYLDPLHLSTTDSTDKAAAKKSLRFHVSQVAQKAAARERRRRVGTEGDEDAPRRSKEQARRAVLQRQNHGSALGEGQEGKKVRLDGEEFGERDLKDARAVRGDKGEGAEGEEGEGDDYYDLVSQAKREGTRAKKRRYDEERAAEKEEILSLAESTIDGPRSATRKMLANKGLTPKRKKENRNARVKKRVRYDKAQKKLGSMQAQYKGGEARSGYEGEGGGISRRNVKSRKLG